MRWNSERSATAQWSWNQESEWPKTPGQKPSWLCFPQDGPCMECAGALLIDPLRPKGPHENANFLFEISVDCISQSVSGRDRYDYGEPLVVPRLGVGTGEMTLICDVDEEHPCQRSSIEGMKITNMGVYKLHASNELVSTCATFRSFHNGTARHGRTTKQDTSLETICH
jgi:hypothetical protein